MKLYKAFSMLLAGLAVTACSNDDSIDNPATSADTNSYLSVALQLPANIKTRDAAGEQPATSKESTINNLLVACFDGTESITDAFTLTPAQFTVNGTGTLVPQKVSNAVKKVFIIANPTAKFSAAFT